MSTPENPSPAPGLWTRRQWIGAACAGLALTGCDKLGKFSLRSTLPLRGTIHALIWGSYFPQDLLEQFQAKTGIRVEPHLFSSNDQLPDLLRTRAAPYDLVMPSSFMGAHLRNLGLLKPFTAANLPNLGQIDRVKFNPRFDPQNNYVVPYIWGATGIGYNAGRVNGLPKSWADLFAKRQRPDGTNAGVSILDDARFSLGTVLLYLGKSPNTASPDDVERAGDILVKLRSQITSFESDNVARLLATDGIDLAMAWSGDVTRAMLGDPNDGVPSNKLVRLSLPREGAIIFQDCFALPQAAGNPAEAEAFVNYLLQPAVAAQVTDYSLYATTVPASRPLVNRFVLNGPSFFEHPDGIRNNYTLDSVYEIDDVYQRVWQRVKQAPATSDESFNVPNLPDARLPNPASPGPA